MTAGYWHPGGWWLGMGLAMIVFWILVVVAIVLLVRWAATGARGPHETREESALEVLQKRYAKGEITRDQYVQMRDDLERGR
jgi:putative membrane protein